MTFVHQIASKKSLEDFHQAALLACRVAVEKQGEAVVLLDLHELPAPTEYLVIVTGRSHAHARGLAQALKDTFDGLALAGRGIEGYPDSPWILLDYHGVVAHVFLSEERDYYNLERLWPQAKAEKVEGLAEAMRKNDDHDRA